jgi:protein-S-isoprenylcysteine O-methyltransferase Ste14
MDRLPIIAELADRRGVRAPAESTVTDEPPPALLYVPPPLMFVLAFLAGVGVQAQLPLPAAAPEALRSAGAILALLGLFLALWCAWMFLAARTTVIPHGRPHRLLRAGPYRFTRNPMYLSLVLVYLGAAAWFAQPWSALLVALPVALVNAVVIPFEERRLGYLFGEEYLRYCATVRRWL